MGRFEGGGRSPRAYSPKLHIKPFKQFKGSRTLSNFIKPLLPKKRTKQPVSICLLSKACLVINVAPTRTYENTHTNTHTQIHTCTHTLTHARADNQSPLHTLISHVVKDVVTRELPSILSVFANTLKASMVEEQNPPMQLAGLVASLETFATNVSCACCGMCVYLCVCVVYTL